MFHQGHPLAEGVGGKEERAKVCTYDVVKLVKKNA